MRPTLLAVLALAPLPALAQCPTDADLETGIRFAVEGGETETFRQLRPDIVEALYEYGDGGGSRNFLAKGVYLLEWVDVNDGAIDLSTRTTYTFPQEVAALPVPTPGGGAVFDVLVNDQGSFDTETQAYSFGPMTQLTFGACTYDMIPVEIRYLSNDGGDVDVLHYMPALGFSYFAASTYDGASETYTYLSIEAVR